MEHASISSPSSLRPPLRARLRRFLTRLLLLGIVLFIAAISYRIWQSGQQRDSDNASQQHLSDSHALQQQQAQQQLLSTIDSLREENRALNERVTELAARISDQGRAHWQLAEVLHLTRLAEQRLTLGSDIAGAQSLLEAADRVLIDSDDGDLLRLRTLLASTLLTLKSAARVDTSGLYTRLTALDQSVETLSLPMFAGERDQQGHIVAYEQKPAAPSAVGNNNVDNNNTGNNASANHPWQDQARQSLDKGWQKIRALFIVRHYDEPVKPLLAPDQRTYVRQNLRLMLEQAALALLRGDQGLWQSSLQKAGHWLQTYFRADSAEFRAASTELNTLLATRITSVHPDLQSLMQLARDIAARRQIEQPAPAPASPTPAHRRDPNSKPLLESPIG